MGTKKHQKPPHAPVRAAAHHGSGHLGAIQIDHDAATLDAQLGERAVRVVFEADGGVWVTLRRRTPAGWVGVSLDLDDVFVAEPLAVGELAEVIPLRAVSDDPEPPAAGALCLPRAA